MDNDTFSNDQAKKAADHTRYVALFGKLFPFLESGEKLTDAQRTRCERAEKFLEEAKLKRTTREEEARNEHAASKQQRANEHQEILWRRAVLKAAATMSESGQEKTPPDFRATFGIEPTEAQLKLWENETKEHAQSHTSDRTSLKNDRLSDYVNREDFDYLPRHFRPHRPSQQTGSSRHFVGP